MKPQINLEFHEKIDSSTYLCIHEFMPSDYHWPQWKYIIIHDHYDIDL